MNVTIIFLILIIYWRVSIALSKLQIDLDQFEVLTESLTTVLSACKGPELNNIGIVTDSNASMKWTKESLRKVSLITINNTEKFQQFSRTFQQDRKIRTFVLILHSPDNLKSTIKDLRRTKWWNPSALYLILDDHSTQDGCHNARQALKIAWKENLLSSTFLCVRENGLQLYTYNPFTSWAPQPWREAIKDSEDNDPWTLLVQSFDQSRTSCENLDFSKTRTLGGYPVNAVGLHSPPSLAIDLSKKSLTKLGGVDGTIATLLWSKLNASLRLTGITNNTHYYEYLPLVSSGVYDLLMNIQYIFNKPNMTMTYPHVNSGISILTRYPENESAHAKILKFMNPVFILGVILVCLGTVILLQVFFRRGATDASLEVLRMMLNNSMLRFPRRSSLRIYLVTVFLLFTLTVSTFQSNLSSLLTSSTPRLPVDSIDALKASRFTIYAYHGYKNAVFDDVLFSRVKTVDHWDCSDYVIKLKNVACAADRSTLLGIAFEKNLHLSKHRINTLYSGLVVRSDWPLRSRVGELLMHMSQGGLIDHSWDRTMTRYVHKWLGKSKDAGKKGYHVMRLKDLAFAFYILIFGLVGSLVAFLLEIMLWRTK
ncbi:uncharacterized protein LOC143341083 [Colletes latitarsis]|uniref:uncharacterized protein LOC143341083 n=1 Tax=Colletes latitarsis TaxID=2605962 RepID=UPI00403636BF